MKETKHSKSKKNENETPHANEANYGPIYTPDNNAIQKPRRINTDTLSYCLAIPLDNNNSPEENSLLVENIVTEIENEIASISTNEKGSLFLEQLLQILTSAKMLKTFISGFMGYIVYLSTNRFGSHVLQSLFTKIAKIDDTGNDEEESKTENEEVTTSSETKKYSSLEEYVLEIAKEVLPHMEELMVHVCGSHVLRSLVCTLAGVTLMKKKKIEMIEVPTTLPKYPSCQSVLVNDFMDVILKFKVDTIQNYLVCHSSAGPFLNILLQALTFAEQPPQQAKDTKMIMSFEEHSKADALVQKILTHNPKQKMNIMEYFSTHPVGSTILENIFQYIYPRLYNQIVKDHILPILSQMIQHNISNFVFQSCLSSPSCDEEMALMIFQQLETTTIQDEQSNNHILNCLKYCLVPYNNRRGVFWKICLLCTKYEICGDKIFQCMQSVFYENDNNQQEDVGKKKKKKHLICSIQSCLPKLLFQANQEKMDWNGARIIEQLLQFHSFPDLVKDVLDGIVNALSIRELDRIIKDGTISRCVMDGILNNKSIKEKHFKSMIQKLYLRLKGKWIYYAVDRIGQYTTIKLFKLLFSENRVLLVEELAEHWGRLQGSPIGKHVIEELGIDAFVEKGDAHWKKHHLSKSGSGAKKEEDVEEKKARKRKRKSDKLNEKEGVDDEVEEKKDVLMVEENSKKDTLDGKDASKKKKKKKKKWQYD